MLITICIVTLIPSLSLFTRTTLFFKLFGSTRIGYGQCLFVMDIIRVTIICLKVMEISSIRFTTLTKINSIVYLKKKDPITLSLMLLKFPSTVQLLPLFSKMRPLFNLTVNAQEILFSTNHL